MNLWRLFEGLGAAHQTAEFIAERIAGCEGYRVAKDRSGRPALLIEHAAGVALGMVPGVELRLVSFWPVAACEVGENGQMESGLFAIVRLKSDDHAIHRLFLVVLTSWIEMLGSRPSLSHIRLGFERLVGLFEALTEVRGADAVGLWGELFLVAAATEPESVLRAWHADVRDLYDFQSGLNAIEVKSTTARIRRHDFSLQQLSPPVGMRLLVASLALDAVGDTASMEELVSAVKSQVQLPDLRLRVDEIVASTLGASWREGAAVRFSPRSALASLRFFSDSAIPCVARDLPVEVSDVRFKAELDGIAGLQRDVVGGLSPLHRAILPADRSVVLGRLGQ